MLAGGYLQTRQQVVYPVDMAEPEINAFLAHLTAKEEVSASTQNQALSALVLLYRHVIGREVADLNEVIRARKPTRRPVVMTRDEVKAVIYTHVLNKGGHRVRSTVDRL
jgi:site-specific recombinase XerD